MKSEIVKYDEEVKEVCRKCLKNGDDLYGDRDVPSYACRLSGDNLIVGEKCKYLTEMMMHKFNQNDSQNGDDF